MVVESSEGPSRAAVAGLAAVLLAVPLTGACLLWPRRRVEPAPAADAAAPPTVVRELAPVAVEPAPDPVPDQKPDANGNVWPNQEKHEREALEAMRRANAQRMKTKQGGRGVMGRGPIEGSPEDVDRRLDDLERRAGG